ncbi:hypothetical protein LUX57_45940 [Actinomadura madurae]|uniref:hypothetical protein n=1 Tax=Actinomadura madurae TaxID=1993 RepID=UPI0020D25C65|nr:hypothetical protein [Actinomadura madurae]MCP9971552.1 hypothetical protein [Actinomadura madurae]
MSDTETGEGAARESRAAGGTGAPDGSRPPRIAAAVTGGVLFAAVAAVLALTTPWNPLPGHVPGGHAKADPALDFTTAEIARSQAFDSALAPPAYAGLVTGLALILVLGLTPLGARFIGWATSRTGRRRCASSSPPPRSPPSCASQGSPSTSGTSRCCAATGCPRRAGPRGWWTS